MGSAPWTVIISALALVVSVCAALISYVNHLASGPRISVTNHKLSSRSGEYWLEIRIANSGRSDVAIEDGWCHWLGHCLTDLPKRLSAGSSQELIFRGVLPPPQYSSGSLAVYIGLGNGQTVISRIKLSEEQLGFLDQCATDIASDVGLRQPYSTAHSHHTTAEFQLGESRNESEDGPELAVQSKSKLVVLRRDGDVEEETAALAHELDVSLPSWEVIREIRTEEPGANVIRYAQGLVRDSDTILLILGPSWLGLVKGGTDDECSVPEDVYDIALRAALSSHVHIIPVLLAGAKRLNPGDLPSEMGEIALRNPIDLAGDDKDKQMVKLIRYLKQRSEAGDPYGFRMAVDMI
jgi:hypothetical protein